MNGKYELKLTQLINVEWTIALTFNTNNLSYCVSNNTLMFNEMECRTCFCRNYYFLDIRALIIDLNNRRCYGSKYRSHLYSKIQYIMKNVISIGTQWCFQLKTNICDEASTGNYVQVGLTLPGLDRAVASECTSCWHTQCLYSGWSLIIIWKQNY